MLATHSEDRVYEIIDRWGLSKHTDETITETEELLAELSMVRK